MTAKTAEDLDSFIHGLIKLEGRAAEEYELATKEAKATEDAHAAAAHRREEAYSVLTRIGHALCDLGSRKGEEKG